MRKSCVNYLVLALAAGWLGACTTTPGPSAADYRLAVPQSEAERAYLGLVEGTSTFDLADIQCEILVIDCFDMYCHICQSGAKHVNELYRLTQERGLGGRIKFVGLGVGDSPMEVGIYKEKFKVPFPLFPDRRSFLAKQFGELRLPNLIVLRKQGGKLEVIHRSPGLLGNPAEVLTNLQMDLARATPHNWSVAAQGGEPTCSENSTACRTSGLFTEPGTNVGSGTIR